MSAPISQQASAVEAVTRILVGAVAKPSAKEREFLAERMKDAAVTLRWLERHETAIRKRAEAA